MRLVRYTRLRLANSHPRWRHLARTYLNNRYGLRPIRVSPKIRNNIWLARFLLRHLLNHPIQLRLAVVVGIIDSHLLQWLHNISLARV